ncbi:hypothetical protein PSPO01_16379 [Paraphaeosphaeria sporulosa]
MPHNTQSQTASSTVAPMSKEWCPFRHTRQGLRRVAVALHGY